MKERWSWLVQYGVVIVVALILATVLGATDLFRNTPLVAKGLTAAHLIRFLGYGGALVVLWLAAYRATKLLRIMGSSWHVAEVVVLPLTTLIVIASGHSVCLFMLGAVLDKTMRAIFDWAFILGIVVSAGWLLFGLFNEGVTPAHSDAVGPTAMESGARRDG